MLNRTKWYSCLKVLTTFLLTKLGNVVATYYTCHWRMFLFRTVARSLAFCAWHDDPLTHYWVVTWCFFSFIFEISWLISGSLYLIFGMLRHKLFSQGCLSKRNFFCRCHVFLGRGFVWTEGQTLADGFVGGLLEKVKRERRKVKHMQRKFLIWFVYTHMLNLQR